MSSEEGPHEVGIVASQNCIGIGTGRRRGGGGVSDYAKEAAP